MMMKSREAFNAFVDEQLANTLQTLEQQRTTAQKWKTGMWVLGILPVILFVVVMVFFSDGMQGTVPLTIFSVAAVALLLGAGLWMRNRMVKRPAFDQGNAFRHDFKTQVVRPIIAFLHPDWHYQPLQHASYEEFTESGLFAPQEYRITGNDQVYGKINDIAFQCCDLEVTIMPVVTLLGQGPNVVFKGSYYMAQYPRSFRSPVYVISRNTLAEKVLTTTHEDNGYINTWNLGKKVLPPDAAFNRLFMVYAPDQEHAQQLLTPTVMERIKALQERTDAKLYLSFFKNRIYIGVSNGVDYFETGLHQSLNNRQLLYDYYLDFLYMQEVMEDLSRNPHVWAAAADKPL